MVWKVNGWWRVSWQVGGKRRTKLFDDKKAATEFESRIKLGFISRSIHQSPTVEDYAEKFFSIYPTIKGWRESTRLKAEQMFRLHLIPRLGGLRLEEIRPKDIMEFEVALLKKEKLAPQSIHNIISTLSSLYKFAVVHEDAVSNPCLGIDRVKLVTRLPTFWSFEETDKFMCYVREANYEVFQLSAFDLNTGLRPGELWGLKRDALNFSQAYVDVKRQYCTKTRQIVDTTKTGATRRVPVAREILELIRDREPLGPDELVFPFLYNSYGSLVLRPLMIEAKVRPIRFHDFRHTFASHCAMRGLTVQEIAKLLGHASLSSSEVYIHITEDHLRGLTDRLSHGMNYLRPELGTKVVSLAQWRTT